MLICWFRKGGILCGLWGQEEAVLGLGYSTCVRMKKRRQSWHKGDNYGVLTETFLLELGHSYKGAESLGLQEEKFGSKFSENVEKSAEFINRSTEIPPGSGSWCSCVCVRSHKILN